jgi:hypothetical protein
MRTQMNCADVFEIQDLRNHSAPTVIALALLLARTAKITPDPKRKNFYEVEGSSEVYYIHVSPVNGIIYLLAVWQKCGAMRAGEETARLSIKSEGLGFSCLPGHACPCPSDLAG